MSDDRRDTLQLLKRVAIFSDLSEEECAFVLPRLVSGRFSAGQIVFQEGTACVGLYVVQSGHLRIFMSSAGGRRRATT